LATGEALTVLRGHAASIPGVAFRPDGQEVVTASADGPARVWTLAGKERLILPVAKAPVFHASFSPNGKLIATYSNDLTLRIWDATTGQCLSTADCKTSFLENDLFSPDGMNLLVPFGGSYRIIKNR
jgi:WD40 repeat protein